MAWLLELVSFMWVLAVVRMEFPLTINSWNIKCCYSPLQVVSFNVYLITVSDLLPDLDIRVLMNQVIGEVLDIRAEFWVFSHTQRVGGVLTALSKKIFHSFIVDLQVAHLYPKRQKESIQNKHNSKITGVWQYAACITKRYSLVSGSSFPAFSHFWEQCFTDSWYQTWISLCRNYIWVQHYWGSDDVS